MSRFKQRHQHNIELLSPNRGWWLFQEHGFLDLKSENVRGPTLCGELEAGRGHGLALVPLLLPLLAEQRLRPQPLSQRGSCETTQVDTVFRPHLAHKSVMAHWTDMEIEAQRDEVTCPGSRSFSENPSCSGPRPVFLIPHPLSPSLS